MRETQVRSLGREDPLEKEMRIHSSTIAWKIPWTEEPGRPQSMGSERVRHDWATSLSRCFMKWERSLIICSSSYSQMAQWWRIHLQCRRLKRCGFNPWVRKIPWRRKWQATLVFLLGKSHGQRSLVGYILLLESDMAKRLTVTEQAHTFYNQLFQILPKKKKERKRKSLLGQHWFVDLK